MRMFKLTTCIHNMGRCVYELGIVCSVAEIGVGNRSRYRSFRCIGTLFIIVLKTRTSIHHFAILGGR